MTFPDAVPQEREAHAAPESTPALRAELLEVWNDCQMDLARVASSLGLDRHAAQDVLQDVYLSALEHASPPDEPAELRRWLFRVTINRCRLEHRRRSRKQAAHDQLARRCVEISEIADESQKFATRQELQAVAQALDELPEELRLPLVLRYYCGKDSTEIGEILELSSSTIRGQLRAARWKLAEALKQAGYHAD